MHVRETNPITPSLFPQEDENGYPFFDQITCNLQSVFQMTHQISLSPKLSANDSTQYRNISEKRRCDFNTMMLLCKGDMNCFHQLNALGVNEDNTNFTLTNDKSIIDEIYNTNCFYFDNNNRECKEIASYHNIINGYLSFKSLQENQHNTAYIKENIASSYEKLNNVFLLLSLVVKTGIDLGEDYLLDKDALYLKASKECIQLSNMEIAHNDDKQRRQFFTNIDKIKGIVKCLKGDEIYSITIKEIEAIEIIIKNSYDIESNTKEDKFKIRQLLRGMAISLHSIFIEDLELKQKTNEDATNFRLFNVIFWSFMIMIIMFVNKYFIKHQEYYSPKSKKFFGKPREGRNQTNNKASEANSAGTKNNIEQNKNESQSNTKDKSQYSKEDLEYIEKLKNVKGNAEFIITQ